MLSIAAAFLSQAQPPLALPHWMEGCWEQASGERWTEECWSSPRGNMMIGYSRSGTGAVLEAWEVMQVEMVDTDDPAVVPLTFSASPGGKGRTTFDWLRGERPGVTFVNLSNDYPQRIRYWREGSDLLAEISLADGSKARRWRYRPKPSPPTPQAP